LQTEQIGVAHHQAALALFRAGSDEYRGHLCNFKQCPADKRDCDVPGCGDVSFLQKFANFRFRPESFATDRCVLLFQRHP